MEGGMKVKNFAIDGTELFHPYGMDRKEFTARFPGISGKRMDSFSLWVGYPLNGQDADVLPIVRRIEYKSRPSLHQCDARCRYAKGHSCECSCGGKNHGAGGS
jgi:hypothetical protein